MDFQCLRNLRVLEPRDTDLSLSRLSRKIAEEAALLARADAEKRAVEDAAKASEEMEKAIAAAVADAKEDVEARIARFREALNETARVGTEKSKKEPSCAAQ